MKKKVDLPRRATTLDRSLSKVAQSPSKFLPVYNLVPSQLVHGSATCTRCTTKQSCYRRQAPLPLVERVISVTALFLVLHKCGLRLWSTKNKITSSNHRSTHRDESIRIPSNFLQLAQSAGKITQVQGAIVFIYLFIGSKTVPRFFKPITRRSNRHRVISFESHLQTSRLM